MIAMIFSKKNAGKWVASTQGKVIAVSAKLDILYKKIGKRNGREKINFDKVPSGSFIGGSYGI